MDHFLRHNQVILVMALTLGVPMVERSEALLAQKRNCSPTLALA